MTMIIAARTLADFADPNVSLFSEKTLEHFRNKKDERIQNSVARENPKQDFWDALNEDRESFKNYKINGKNVDEILRNL